MLFRLESDLARADVSVRGGELQAWYIGGQNLLWERDPEWWDQSAPILFPIVGWTNQGRIKCRRSFAPSRSSWLRSKGPIYHAGADRYEHHAGACKR
jgi:hypothetical protein